MNRDYPLASQKGVLPAQIQNEEWVDIGREAGVFFVQAEDIYRLANFSRASNIVQHLPSFDLLSSIVQLGKGIVFIPASLNLQQETNLLSMPILNADGTLFRQIIIRHVLIRKSEQPKPLVQTLSDSVKSNTMTTQAVT